MSIHQKLSAIQNNLVVPKSQFNSFGKYKYRSCEDILEAVKPLLHENNLTLVICDDIVEIGGRVYVRATVKLHDGQEEIATSALAREALDKKGMDEAQITGAASSYARKYALSGLFCIDDTKDPDSTNKHDETRSTKKVVSDKLVMQGMYDDEIQKLESCESKSDLTAWKEQYESGVKKSLSTDYQNAIVKKAKEIHSKLDNLSKELDAISSN